MRVHRRDTMGKRAVILWASVVVVGILLGSMTCEAASASPAVGKLRTAGEATCPDPVTRAELEAVLEKYRGRSFTFASWGGAMQAALLEAYLKPFQERFGLSSLEESGLSSAQAPAMV